MNRDAPIRAALFDMDGVITDTATVHAETWKRLFDELLEARGEPEFELGRDYRTYVDGKPRHDGIRDFLASRGIELPEGEPDDDAETQTVFGLGRRKQAYFEAHLDAHPVGVYPGSLRLVEALREREIPVGIFSSSRNLERVLESAGALELFGARVDGRELDKLGIPGKPDPAMLLEAAARLGVAHRDTLVVEDAISGVEAAARGEFGLVVGVSRGADEEALARGGAHLVVHDLAELELTEASAISVKTLASVPSVWSREDELRARVDGEHVAVFLDYDGTLTPIVERPEDATLAEDMRAAVASLAARCDVAVITGRGLREIRRLVGIDALTLAGSHGFEIGGAEGEAVELERGVEILPVLDEAERELTSRLEGIPGSQVERKRFSLSVHHRRAAPEDAHRIEAIVDDVLGGLEGLRKGHGRKVFRIQPDVPWDKGRAVLWVLERFERDGSRRVPIFVGDDLTDEDAFAALAGRGITVVVRDGPPRATSADYSVEDVADVKRLLERLEAVVARSAREVPR